MTRSMPFAAIAAPSSPQRMATTHSSLRLLEAAMVESTTPACKTAKAIWNQKPCWPWWIFLASTASALLFDVGQLRVVALGLRGALLPPCLELLRGVRLRRHLERCGQFRLAVDQVPLDRFRLVVAPLVARLRLGEDGVRELVRVLPRGDRRKHSEHRGGACGLVHPLLARTLVRQHGRRHDLVGGNGHRRMVRRGGERCATVLWCCSFRTRTWSGAG
jgi:hypothetical protein